MFDLAPHLAIYISKFSFWLYILVLLENENFEMKEVDGTLVLLVYKKLFNKNQISISYTLLGSLHNDNFIHYYLYT